MQTELNGVLTIEEGGIRGLLRFIKAIADAEQRGYEIDPLERDEFIPKQIVSGTFRVKMLLKEAKAKENLKELSKEELLETINNTTKKVDLLGLAKLLEVDIPVDVKHPTAIAKCLREFVTNE